MFSSPLFWRQSPDQGYNVAVYVRFKLLYLKFIPYWGVSEAPKKSHV